MPRFHLVCHDCDAENVVHDNERYVRELKDGHEEQNPGHWVEYAELEEQR
jgi:hypothetical protein